LRRAKITTLSSAAVLAALKTTTGRGNLARALTIVSAIAGVMRPVRIRTVRASADPLLQPCERPGTDYPDYRLSTNPSMNYGLN
jgi:hypothetical protein